MHSALYISNKRCYAQLIYWILGDYHPTQWRHILLFGNQMPIHRFGFEFAKTIAFDRTLAQMMPYPYTYIPLKVKCGTSCVIQALCTLSRSPSKLWFVSGMSFPVIITSFFLLVLVFVWMHHGIREELQELISWVFMCHPFVGRRWVWDQSWKKAQSTCFSSDESKGIIIHSPGHWDLTEFVFSHNVWHSICWMGNSISDSSFEMTKPCDEGMHNGTVNAHNMDYAMRSSWSVNKPNQCQPKALWALSSFGPRTRFTKDKFCCLWCLECLFWQFFLLIFQWKTIEDFGAPF